MGKKGKIVGLGGVFFKCDDPEKTKSWYSEKLGLKSDQYGGVFQFRKFDHPEEVGHTVWSPFEKNTKYFEPSSKSFMINYRVENIEELVEELKADGVEVVDDIETYEYGKFVHIMDLEGNKIELWEPIDQPFVDMYEGKATRE